MTSACDVLHEEPERFLNYILADSKLRSSIFDKVSFADALEKALRSDPSLEHIADTIKRGGEDFEVCGSNIYEKSEIQALIRKNNKEKVDRFSKRVKKQRPSLSGSAFEKEVMRRVKISNALERNYLQKQKPTQITIQSATKPIKVTADIRGKRVKYRKTKYRSLTKGEEMLIRNNLNLDPQQVIEKYYAAGLKYRTPISIRRHYYRMKKRLKK